MVGIRARPPGPPDRAAACPALSARGGNSAPLDSGFHRSHEIFDEERLADRAIPTALGFVSGSDAHEGDLAPYAACDFLDDVFVVVAVDERRIEPLVRKQHE